MRRAATTLAALLIAAPAAAQYRESESLRERLQWDDEHLNVMLDMRFDARADGGLPEGRKAGFEGQTFKLSIEGDVVPGIRYRFRQRFDKSYVPQRGGLAAGTDFAWLAFDLGARKAWTVTAGKQSVLLGTFEYDYNGADVYLPTMVFDDFDGHKPGVNVARRFAGQTLNLQLFNSDSPQFATADYGNKALGASLMWQGRLWDGALCTRWAYTVFQHTRERVYGWATAGVQLNAGRMTAELDYYHGDRDMDYGAAVGAQTGLRPVRDRSAALNVELRAGRWRPSVKGVWNDRRDRGADRTAYFDRGGAAAVEFYPFAGHDHVSDLRLHAACGFVDTSAPGVAGTAQPGTRYFALAGLRWLFKAK